MANDARLPEETDVPGEAELTERFWGRIRLFASRRLTDGAGAEDAAQETLWRVVRAVRSGRLQKPQSLAAFVFQTARHVCAQHNRSERRRLRALGRMPGEATEPSEPFRNLLLELVAKERRDLVIRALARLSTEDRQLLELLYYEGLRPTDIARRLSIRPEALRVRKHRALQRLAGHLTGLEGRLELNVLPIRDTWR